MNTPILTHTHCKYTEQVGKKLKVKQCYFYKNNNFFALETGMRVILMSDLHSLTEHIIDDLIKKKKIDKHTIVISTGDMAGNNKIGGNGDPYPSYAKILKHAAKFYFVNGNHDIANTSNNSNLVNPDNTICAVGTFDKLQTTIFGGLTGVDGIAVNDEQIDNTLHKYSNIEYDAKLQAAYSLKPDILLTHQPIQSINPALCIKYYVCGHYHIDPHIQMFDTYAIINLDNKILIFE